MSSGPMIQLRPMSGTGDIRSVVRPGRLHFPSRSLWHRNGKKYPRVPRGIYDSQIVRLAVGGGLSGEGDDSTYS